MDLFTALLQEEPAETPATWACSCGGCAGAGGADLGAYGTTPTANYGYVSTSQPTGGDAATAALMAGSKWTSFDAASARTIISYSFINPQASTFSYGVNDGFAATAKSFSEADKALTRDMLAKIAAVCNVEFVEVPDNATQSGVLRYGYSDQPAAMNYAGYAFFPSTSPIGGDIWLASTQSTAQWDFYRPNLVLHETMHALGLKHPFSGGSVLSAAQDIIPNTVMSYSPLAGGTSGYMETYPSEPMAFDVTALQQLYGASSLASGNSWYGLAGSDFQSGFKALWDSGGYDTLDASMLAHAVTLNLGGGAASDIGVRIDANAKVGGTPVATTYAYTLTMAQGTLIEQAIGTAFGDTVTGNAADNRLQGRGGDDGLQGGAGRDTALYEGARNSFDVTIAGTSATVRDRTGAEGTDSLGNIERLEFADGGLALDLDGHAGEAARILGAVFGAAAVDVPAAIGVALDVLDGGVSYRDALALALDARLGDNASNAQVVDLLYTNLFGMAPNGAATQELVGLLDRSTLSQVDLAAIAAGHALNEQNIDLVGLAAHGLAFA
ncbi:MAG: M10 family metallopeptidase C-terminal domain-containing protein [Burkholderiales bacterium]|nr:M10 family metallopeptidase C-terminal domain-containing protein [Burkholderiales bacterium]